MTPGPAPAAEPPDALAATLPLLRALLLPAILFRVDGTILAASAAFEELIGGPIEGADQEALADRLRVRYPTGRVRSWDDLRRSLERERNPTIAMDFFDRNGRFHAMVASAALVDDGKKPAGVVIVFSHVTELIDPGAPPRHP